jgi:glycosyltransferase involved in cell wall biosynthesis
VTVATDGLPLKILHIDPERNWGGGEEQVLGLINHLSKKGHDNHLATVRRGRLFERGQNLGIKTLAIKLGNHLDVRSVPALRRLINREHYDIVHLHTKRAHALSLWLPHGQCSPKYLVTRRMDYAEPDNWYTHVLYNRRVDGVVAISQRIAGLLMEAGVQREKIRLIHSGIDLQKLQRRGRNTTLTRDGPVIGTAGVLEERKGHRYLLQAAAVLKRQGVRLKCRIAGEGALRGDLQRRALELGIGEDVEFVGFVGDIYEFLSTIDIFVLPSLYEGLGVVVLEAMGAGKPVVASRVGGIVDSVVDSTTGFLVVPGNDEALAGAIGKLIDDPALAEVMGARGAERVREKFTMEAMAEKNEAYYYDLLRADDASKAEKRRSVG